MQGVSHYRDDGSFRPNLTRAFLRFDIDPGFSLFLGRVGMEMLMRADTRMVGYSYLPIRPAIEFYGVVPINYIDGVDARLSWPVGNGILRVDGSFGIARETLPKYNFSGASVAKGSLGYDIGAWQFRYIYVQAKLPNENEALTPLRDTLTLVGARGVADRLAIKDKVSAYHSLGAAYDDGDWQAQAAVNSIRHEPMTFQNSYAFNALVGRRFGSVTPYVGYAQIKSNAKTLASGLPNNPFFAQINSGLAQALTSSHADSRTVSLGARWDFRRNMDLKAQVDFLRTSKDSKLLLNNVDSDWNGRATVFSLSLDFIF